ncbi:hypothetical protein DW204_12060 [Phocaeicola plebeius]|jgi:hypothetical protein|uniref:Type II toxin-antitoxin system RelE/ParE family toxin n=1 Tax=Phocaeicola plebeius TaxID=310297 RepID=A0A414WU22_9BACT|nr:hypothetical protein [Phocaeicola plebeius]RHH41618.1 hypothetical protein DW204_12060 [Phocaeicola plebeius]
MRTFALENIEYIKGIQVFSKLIIDGQAPFDAFVNNLEDVYKPELASIIYYMESVSQLKPLPKTKFRELKGNKDKVKEYEFKSKHLRIYAIQQKNGKIVIMGGYKNTQTKDINTFRALKMQYLNSLK